MIDFLTSRGWEVEIGPRFVTLYHKGTDVIATYPTIKAAYRATGGM